MPPLSTQPYLPQSPQIDTPEASNMPLPHLRVDASTSAHLASEVNLPGVRLMGADDVIFGVYQNWVHQNPGIHLDGVLDEDGKWQAICKDLFFCPPNATTYHLSGSREVFS